MFNIRVLYIGETNDFAKMLVSRLDQEDEEVFIVAPEAFPLSYNIQRKYKFFKQQNDPWLNQIIYDSINPDVVIFAGKGYFDDVWNEDIFSSDYISALHNWCELCVKSKGVEFIHLSSTQALDEQPETNKGICYALAKKVLAFYREKGLNRIHTIFCDSIFTFEYELGDGSFLSNIALQVNQSTRLKMKQDQKLYPVYAGDVVDAILRVMLRQKIDEYIICASEGIKKSELYRYFSDKKTINLDILSPQILDENPKYVNYKAKSELEWTDFHSIQSSIDEQKIKCKGEKSDPINSHKLFSSKNTLRKIIENIFIFLLFFGLDYFAASNSVLSSLNIMTLYIVVVSSLYGISGGFLGVILRGLAILLNAFIVQVDVFDFGMYLNTMITITQSVFITLVVAYPIDYLRGVISKKNMLIEDAEKLKNEIEEINQTNVIIKNEYQQRLLDAKNSFSVLHNATTRINSLQTDRIFMELVEVVADLIGTSTVSVYRFQNNSRFLRLVTKLNNDSILNGYSINLDDYPQMKESVENGKVYTGNTWKNEPALVAPILNNMQLTAIIIINNLAFEKQTLYQINLLRTITALTSDSINKAISYEQLIENNLYISGTNILKQVIMKQKISLEKEKAEKQLSNYVLLEIDFNKDNEYTSIYPRLEKLIRRDDILGLGENDELLLLLPSTPISNIELVLKRFKEDGLEVNVIESDLPYVKI